MLTKPPAQEGQKPGASNIQMTAQKKSHYYSAKKYPDHKSISVEIIWSSENAILKKKKKKKINCE